MAKIVIEGSSVSASQLKELFNQIANGALNGDHMQAFIEHRDPFLMPTSSIIHLPPITTTGRTVTELIRDLEKSGFRVSNWAKDVMSKKAFTTTNGKTYKLGMIKGSDFDHDPSTDEVRARIASLGGITPSPECAPYLRELVSDKDLEAIGIWWIVVMHESIEDSGGVPDLLYVDRDDDGQWLHAYHARPGDRWDRRGGFAFLLPQVGSQN